MPALRGNEDLLLPPLCGALSFKAVDHRLRGDDDLLAPPLCGGWQIVS